MAAGRCLPCDRVAAAPRGFTLLEMLLVIVLAGILLSIVTVSVSPDPRQNLRQDAARIGQLFGIAADESRIRQAPILWEADLTGYRFVTEVNGERQLITDDARIAAARQDIAQIMGALKLYRLDNGRYPSTEQGLRALVEKPTAEPLPTNWKQGGYLERTTPPKDPWGRDYQYLNPGLRGEIDVFSFGRDGQSGGEGPDAEIGSWSL